MMCVMGAAILPLVAISRTHDMDRLAAESDVKDNLYSRFLYILVAVSVVFWINGLDFTDFRYTRSCKFVALISLW